MNALKLSLIPPVGLDSVPTVGALLGCISRIHVLYPATVSLSLIGEKLFQLVERPTMKLSTKNRVSFTALSNVLKCPQELLWSPQEDSGLLS